MEEFVNLSIYAEAYYSGQTHEENIQIRKSTYEQLKDEIDEVVCYIPDLDGKHSEVRADIQVEIYPAYELMNDINFLSNDGDRLKWKLEEIFEEHNLDLSEEIKFVKQYIDELDPLKEVKVIVRSSQVQQIISLASELMRNKGEN